MDKFVFVRRHKLEKTVSVNNKPKLQRYGGYFFISYAVVSLSNSSQTNLERCLLERRRMQFVAEIANSQTLNNVLGYLRAKAHNFSARHSVVLEKNGQKLARLYPVVMFPSPLIGAGDYYYLVTTAESFDLTVPFPTEDKSQMFVGFCRV